MVSCDLHFFACGDGDTLLIRGGNEWALIDANLAKHHGTEDRLLKVLTANGSPKLKLVCITHFDTDHIRGLGQFMQEYCAPKDNEPSGPWPRLEQVALPFEPDSFLPLFTKLFEHWLPRGSSITRAFKELLDALGNFWSANHVEGDDDGPLVCYRAGESLATPSRRAIPCSLGPWEVRFLGPRAATRRNFAMQWETEMGLLQWPDPDVIDRLIDTVGDNSVSQIIALTHKDTGESVLLTGDATQNEIERAIEYFSHFQRKGEIGQVLRVIKASHHGSFTARASTNCHHRELYSDHGQPGKTNVVISCLGTFGSHPALQVLDDIKEAKLSIRLTGNDQSRELKPKRGLLPGISKPFPKTHSADIKAVFGAKKRAVIDGGRDSHAYHEKLRSIAADE